mmetsp:Transcript_21917/g.25899  ORF Transcript_21917/g.25899 Transcript_21917/m.25899 type:complete len:80 (-) Transcript_21917:107-346(-)
MPRLWSVSSSPASHLQRSDSTGRLSLALSSLATSHRLLHLLSHRSLAPCWDRRAGAAPELVELVAELSRPQHRAKSVLS